MGCRLTVEVQLNVHEVQKVAKNYGLPMPIEENGGGVYTMNMEQLQRWFDSEYSGDDYEYVYRMLNIAFSNTVRDWMNHNNRVMSMEARTFEQIFKDEKLQLVFN